MKHESPQPPHEDVEFSGAPEPLNENILDTAIWFAFAGIVAVGLVLLPSVFGRGATRGGTRSARIEWQLRQAEADEAIRDQPKDSAVDDCKHPKS